MTAGWWFSTGSIELALRLWQWAMDALLTLYRRAGTDEAARRQPRVWVAAVLLAGLAFAILPRTTASLPHDAVGFFQQEHTVAGGAGNATCALEPGFGFHLEAAHSVPKADGHPSPDPRCIADGAIAIDATILASVTTREFQAHLPWTHTGLWARAPPSVI